MQIIFEFNTQYGTYRDALYFEDNAIPDDATIEAMKQERLNKWIFFNENPPPLPSYIEIDGVKYEKIQTDGQIILKPVEA